MNNQTTQPQLAFVFPGQGSQSVGMLAEMAAAHPEVEQTFREASEVLGYDLWAVVSNGPDTELSKTYVTQPAMLVSAVALWRVWCAQGGAMPAQMAGHSLGEYTALVCAGALDFKTAVSLVEQRGRFMQDAVPEGAGAMAAIIGLDDDKVVAACEAASEGAVVSAVNFNSPGQVVIAGETDAVKRAMVAVKEAGAKRALPLPVSVPSHCLLMKPAAERMATLLNDVTIDSPTIPVINNVDGVAASDADAIKDALVRQLYLPVLWVSGVQQMVKAGATTMIECGPGKVLAGLNKRIERSLQMQSVNTADGLAASMEAVAALQGED